MPQTTSLQQGTPRRLSHLEEIIEVLNRVHNRKSASSPVHMLERNDLFSLKSMGWAEQRRYEGHGIPPIPDQDAGQNTKRIADVGTRKRFEMPSSDDTAQSDSEMTPLLPSRGGGRENSIAVAPGPHAPQEQQTASGTIGSTSEYAREEWDLYLVDRAGIREMTKKVEAAGKLMCYAFYSGLALLPIHLAILRQAPMVRIAALIMNGLFFVVSVASSIYKKCLKRKLRRLVQRRNSYMRRNGGDQA